MGRMYAAQMRMSTCDCCSVHSIHVKKYNDVYHSLGKVVYDHLEEYLRGRLSKLPAFLSIYWVSCCPANAGSVGVLIHSHSHTFTLSHFYTFTSSHFHIFVKSRFHTFTSSCFHILTVTFTYLERDHNRKLPPLCTRVLTRQNWW